MSTAIDVQALGHLTLTSEDQAPVHLTDKAVEMVREAMALEKDDSGQPYAGLRVIVQGGGCSGFQYGLDFDQAPKPGDFELTTGGLTVFVDAISAMMLEGTTIDYVMGLSGAGFKFNNPGASNTCGCGSSFN